MNKTQILMDLSDLKYLLRKDDTRTALLVLESTLAYLDSK